MRVLLTGAAGFIGSHVAEALTAAGHEVVALDLHPCRQDTAADLADLDVSADVRPRGGAVRSGGGVVADVRDAQAVARCLEGVDVVCHQAAKVGLGVDITDMPDYASVNVAGTAVLLAEMARAGVGRLVLASSMVIYGEGTYRCRRHGDVRPGPRDAADLSAGRFEPLCPDCGAPLEPGVISEEMPPDPRNVYADTKLAQEHLAASWARTTGGGVVALRYHNVYGPRMPRDTPYAGVAAIFRSALARGEAPQVFEDGGQRRDFVHVRDVAHANRLAVESVRPDGTLAAFNIASGEPHTVGEMAHALSTALDGPHPEVTGSFRLGDVRHIVASPARAATHLGFHAQISFDQGMAEFATESPTPPTIPTSTTQPHTSTTRPSASTTQPTTSTTQSTASTTQPTADTDPEPSVLPAAHDESGPLVDLLKTAGTDGCPQVVDVVLPCLDEAEALPWVLTRMPAGFRPIVVDNGSTDGSGEIARGLGALVVAEPVRGFGAACHAGLLAATADVVCFMDADGSLDPGDLPGLVARLGDADLVLGRRRPTGRGTWPPHARLGNAVLARALSRRGGTRLRDLGPMRAARREGLIALGLTDRRFGYPLEMVVRAAEESWRIVEADVPYGPRSGGRSKVTGTVRGTFRTVRDMRRVLSA
jgi:dTDP-L-rhamnose 4-epimerase